VLEVEQRAGDDALQLRVPCHDTRSLGAIAARVRRVFDLGADPVAVDACLASDPLLARSVRAHPGLRVPGAFDGFELAVRAVLGQQISVAAARTLAGRLVARFGEAIDGEQASARIFPAPERLFAADLRAIGLTGARARGVRELSRAVLEGELCFDGARTLEATVDALCAVPGVGPWTAHYIAMRACADPDAFPHADLGLARAAGAALRTPRALLAHAERWRPWRAYAALHLWSMGEGAAQGPQCRSRSNTASVPNQATAERGRRAAQPSPRQADGAARRAGSHAAPGTEAAR
jgi:AraC family transcriptional regulator of adaptative response / DNA-3-methyladenine glycosylase II